MTNINYVQRLVPSVLYLVITSNTGIINGGRAFVCVVVARSRVRGHLPMSCGAGLQLIFSTGELVP